LEYLVNNNFKYESVFTLNADHVLKSVLEANVMLIKNPVNLYRTLDLKTISSIVGAIFCNYLAMNIDGAMVNPIEKGHPDIVPKIAINATEAELRNYPNGLEIKTTIGNIKTGAALKPGEKRLDFIAGITWQAHHREVRELMGLIWDFNNTPTNGFLFPMVTGVFFSSDLTYDDWGVISGTTGRNTKVCGMTAGGRRKMKNGWVIIHEEYNKRYNQLL